MRLKEQDSKIKDLIDAEEKRQRTQLNLIPSENLTSEAVREAVGSVLMHKYSEGNIGRRYYEGNEFIDSLEELCISRAKELFKLPKDWGVNVQALSGSNANLASLLAVLEPGDTILSMYLPDGGHLSHGWSYEPDTQVSPENPVYLQGSRKVHIVAKLYNVIQYKTDPDTNLIDYNSLAKITKEHKPKIIITGGTAYPRDIDYAKVRKIADSVGALYLADIAHEAGLIATGSLPSPVGIADVVTMTTHKTLRAARGSIILASNPIIKKINRAVLPGLQGGPFNNNIAGICVGLGEALKPEFKAYTDNVISNAIELGNHLKKAGFTLISGGTDKHLILIDLTSKETTGKIVSKALAKAGIILNMNTIPGEKRSPSNPSGIRLGTPFITTQGAQFADMKTIASWITTVIENLENEEIIQSVAHEVEQYMQSLNS